MALLNPGTIGTTATLTFARSGASAVVEHRAGAGRTRASPWIRRPSRGWPSAEFSTKVESDQPLIVDRTMSWDVAHGYGAHAETAVAAPALDVVSRRGRDAQRLQPVLPAPEPQRRRGRRCACATCGRSGAPLEKTYALPPNSRNNIWVNQEDFPGLGKALAATDVSAVIESIDRPAHHRRARDVPGPARPDVRRRARERRRHRAGDAVVPGRGRHGPLLRPVRPDRQSRRAPTRSSRPPTCCPTGTVVTKPYTVAANSRFNIWVDGEDARLANTAVSTTIRSTNGVPVIVERAMWWPGGRPVVRGAQLPGRRRRRGRRGRWPRAKSAARAASTPTSWSRTPRRPTGTVKVTLLFEDGTSAERTFTVAANSRFNVDARSGVPGARSTSASAPSSRARARHPRRSSSSARCTGMRSGSSGRRGPTRSRTKLQ